MTISWEAVMGVAKRDRRRFLQGENFVIEGRSGDGQPDPACALAFELARLGVDVIVTAGGDITRCAKAATSSIPVVMTNDDDPIGSGAIASLGNAIERAAAALGLTIPQSVLAQATEIIQ